MSDNFDEILLENNLKQKIQKEMEAFKPKNNKKKQEKTFENLSAEELFSIKSFWKVFNRQNGTTSIINGLQAEAYIGVQDNVRYEITTHKTDCFLAKHLYIEFLGFN